jgi:hypothetical protein
VTAILSAAALLVCAASAQQQAVSYSGPVQIVLPAAAPGAMPMLSPQSLTLGLSPSVLPMLPSAPEQADAFPESPQTPLKAGEFPQRTSSELDVQPQPFAKKAAVAGPRKLPARVFGGLQMLAREAASPAAAGSRTQKGSEALRMFDGEGLKNPEFIEVGAPVDVVIENGPVSARQYRGEFISFDRMFGFYDFLIDGEARRFYLENGKERIRDFVLRSFNSEEQRSVPQEAVQRYREMLDAYSDLQNLRVQLLRETARTGEKLKIGQDALLEQVRRQLESSGAKVRIEPAEAYIANMQEDSGQDISILRDAYGRPAAFDMRGNYKMLVIEPDDASAWGRLAKAAFKRNKTQLIIDPFLRPHGQKTSHFLVLHPLSIFSDDYPGLNPDAMGVTLHELHHVHHTQAGFIRIPRDRLDFLPEKTSYSSLLDASEMRAHHIHNAKLRLEAQRARARGRYALMHLLLQTLAVGEEVLRGLACYVELFYSEAYEALDKGIHAEFLPNGSVRVEDVNFTASTIRTLLPASLLLSSGIDQGEQVLKVFLLKTIRQARRNAVQGDIRMQLAGQKASPFLWNALRQATDGILRSRLEAAVREIDAFRGIAPTALNARRLLAEVFKYDFHKKEGPLLIKHPKGLEYRNRLTGRGVLLDRVTGRILSFSSDGREEAEPISDHRAVRWSRLDKLGIPD